MNKKEVIEYIKGDPEMVTYFKKCINGGSPKLNRIFKDETEILHCVKNEDYRNMIQLLEGKPVNIVIHVVFYSLCFSEYHDPDMVKVWKRYNSVFNGVCSVLDELNV